MPPQMPLGSPVAALLLSRLGSICSPERDAEASVCGLFWSDDSENVWNDRTYFAIAMPKCCRANFFEHRNTKYIFVYHDVVNNR
jgi:hypothetical protein